MAETWDGWLNDISGFHVKPAHAIEALNSARSGLVAGETMTGIDGHRVISLPHDRVRETLRKYNR